MNFGLLLLRLVVGLTLAAHGSQKLFGWFGGGGRVGTGVFFEQHLNFRPGRTYATMAGAAEFGAGVALLLGLLTPLAAVTVIGVMGVAGWAAHRSSGFFITKGGYEYTVVLAAVAGALAFTGPGAFSIDRALGWHLYGSVWGIAAALFGLLGAALVLSGRGRVVEAAPGAGAGVEGGREAAMDRATGADERIPTDAQS